MSKRVLAVDFGKQKVGLAFCDISNGIVFGRDVLKGYKSLDCLFNVLKERVKEDNVDTMVFGLPLGIDGEETEQTNRIRNIVNEHKALFAGVEIKFEDESFTTYEANKTMQNDGFKVKNDDEMAARIIMQRFLKNIL